MPELSRFFGIIIRMYLEVKIVVMQHKIHSIKSFHIVAPYTLEIIFDDNKFKTINFIYDWEHHIDELTRRAKEWEINSSL